MLGQPVRRRLLALDWMRGVVMVLMAIDHASAAFNRGRLATDSAFMYEPGTALPAAQFWTRWVTHLCAPTFLFLAGTALALSVERRIRSGEDSWSIDRHLLVRGLIIAALDLLLISWFWYPGDVLLQVLYAIGVSLILMVPLRRLSTRWLVGAAAVLILFGEALAGIAMALAGGQLTVPGALLLHGGRFPGLVVGYPVLPWLAMMMLGWAFGRHLLDARTPGSSRTAPRRVLLLGGLCGVAVFVALRAANGYGNMTLLRDDGSLIQWMHLSKYPPSLTFTALQLGLMALALVSLMRLGDRLGDRAGTNNPILVYGQTALFFYVLHIPMLELTAHALGVHKQLGLGAAYLATAVALIVLYPICRWYRSYKTAHPRSWARYI